MFGLNPWMLGGFAALVLALATFGGCQYVRAEDAEAAEVVAKANAHIAIEANKGHQATIDALKASNDECTARLTPSAEMKEAAAKSASFEKEIDRLNQELAKREKEDYAKPECVLLLDTDFESACPALASGLRERERRHQE